MHFNKAGELSKKNTDSYTEVEFLDIEVNV